MAAYLDTSALAKLYHEETGTAIVERVVEAYPNACFVSRLVLLEMQSVLAQKERAGVVTDLESRLVSLRFRADVRKRRFRVGALRARHYEAAEALIGAHGAARGLRSLDALHLALALDLHRGAMIDSLISADKVLCRVTPLEGLPVIDPEIAVY